MRPRAALALSLCAALLAGCQATDPNPADSRTEGHVEGWPLTAPAAVGLDAEHLSSLARAAGRARSTCYAVVRDGKLAFEANWGESRTSPREAFSVSKSVMSTLVGIAVREGALSLSDTVATYVPQWRGTPSASITVRNLLSNDSGRLWSLETDYAGLNRAPDRTSYALSLPQQHEPGTAWAYNNAAIQVLEPVLRQATGMSVDDYAREKLFEPLGMTHTRLTKDSGRDSGHFGMQTTCLDLARFATLHLEAGTFKGRRILSRAWVRESVGKPSTAHAANYGLLWWLNVSGPLRGPTDPVDDAGQPVTPRTGQLAPGAPQDMYAAQGHGGQIVLVDPGSRTVVVRLGRPPLRRIEGYTFADAAAVVTAPSP